MSNKEVKNWLEKDDLPEEFRKDFTMEELTKFIHKYWYDKPKDNIVVWTGIEGRLDFQQQVVESVGGTYTEEQREKDRQDLINSGQTMFKI